MQNEILNNLMAVKQRIDGQRAELANELNRLEAKKVRAAAGQSEKPNSFSLEDVLNNDRAENIEEINRKIANIKAALALPYYADSEYRDLSIAYMEAITAAAAADLAKNDTEIEAAEKAVEEANENLVKVKEQRDDINEAVLTKVSDVGLGGVVPEAAYCTPEHLLNRYKNLCSKYN